MSRPAPSREPFHPSCRAALASSSAPSPSRNVAVWQWEKLMPRAGDPRAGDRLGLKPHQVDEIVGTRAKDVLDAAQYWMPDCPWPDKMVQSTVRARHRRRRAHRARWLPEEAPEGATAGAAGDDRSEDVGGAGAASATGAKSAAGQRCRRRPRRPEQKTSSCVVGDASELLVIEDGEFRLTCHHPARAAASTASSRTARGLHLRGQGEGAHAKERADEMFNGDQGEHPDPFDPGRRASAAPRPCTCIHHALALRGDAGVCDGEQPDVRGLAVAAMS